MTASDGFAAAACLPPAKLMARTELFFGAGTVTDAKWKRFLAREVTPRFPEGLTSFDGYGQWKMPSGRIAKERSRILVIWRSAEAAANAKIEAIRAIYKHRFRQLSVMRVDGEDCVSF